MKVESQPANAAHEPNQVRTNVILLSAAGLVGAVACTLLLISLLTSAWNRPPAAGDRQDAAVEAATTTPTDQPLDDADLRALRAREQRWLSGEGALSGEGTAKPIPIEQAMKLAAERGFAALPSSSPASDSAEGEEATP